MNEVITGVQELLIALGPLAWAVLITSFIMFLLFIGVFVWFAKKMMDDFEKPFFKSEYEEENRRLKQQLKEANKRKFRK